MSGHQMKSGASDAEPSFAAEVMLRFLKSSGVDMFFCNPGTDFPSIVETYSRAKKEGTIGRTVPKPVVVPHENAAVAMAHGYYMVSGKPQAVMVHVSVGTGNTLNGITNASRDQTPILLMAGRSPITEQGAHGSRNRPIHWAQEMFDQAGMLRELVKWDYELKRPDLIEAVIARAQEIMMAGPRGPVYVTLPREVLSAPVAASNSATVAKAAPSVAAPDPGAIEILAKWIAEAKRPLIISGSTGRTKEGFVALSEFAERFAIPVIVGRRYVCLPASHSMHMGFEPKSELQDADLVIVLESDVPWLPSLEAPPENCRVIHLGEDPAFARYPFRDFRSDLAIVAGAAGALKTLSEALTKYLPPSSKQVSLRRDAVARARAALHADWKAKDEAAAGHADIKPEWISRCISDAVGEDAIIVNEYPLRLEHCPRTKYGTMFGLSPAGGLGWGLGAAIGAKLASPDKLVIATLGDGTYMFCNPTPCHWVSQVQKAPILTVIYNNQRYGAVRSATLSMYDDARSGEDAGNFLADLSPSPAFEKLVEASGGYGERVERPADLPQALARAIRVVRDEGRQALLNVICRY